MTPQEEQLLGSLIERVNRTQLEEKDPDAEALLNKSLATNPDALYILAQTVLVQNIALEQAKARLAQLEQAPAAQPARATSFLGALLGHRTQQPAPVPVQPGPQAFYQAVNPQYAQQPSPFAQQEYVQPQYVPGMMSGPPSFLRGALQTAAGVAAGALAFEGVESILHGFGHPSYGWGGMGPGLMGGGFERPVEVINNNYYDDAPSTGGEHHGLDAGEHHFHESADQGGTQFHDASYTTQGDSGNDDLSNRGDDTGSFDNDADFDSSNTDDGTGFGDQGGFDNGGGFDGGSGGDLL